jgi:hypothetical protein
MPKRIQMSRQRPWRAANPDAVIVARPSKWGNPFTIAGRGRAVAVASFRQWAEFRVAGGSIDLSELVGRDLACWCPLDQPCHADVLLELANGGA